MNDRLSCLLRRKKEKKEKWMAKCYVSKNKANVIGHRTATTTEQDPFCMCME